MKWSQGAKAAMLVGCLWVTGCDSEPEPSPEPAPDAGSDPDFAPGPQAIAGGDLLLSVFDRDTGQLLCEHAESFGAEGRTSPLHAAMSYYSGGADPTLSFVLTRPDADTVDGPIAAYDGVKTVPGKVDLAAPTAGESFSTQDISSASYQMVCGGVVDGSHTPETVSAVFGFGSLASADLMVSNYMGDGFGEPTFCASGSADCEVATGRVDVVGTLSGEADEGDTTGLRWTLDLQLEGVSTSWTRRRPD